MLICKDTAYARSLASLASLAASGRDLGEPMSDNTGTRWGGVLHVQLAGSRELLVSLGCRRLTYLPVRSTEQEGDEAIWHPIMSKHSQRPRVITVHL